MKFTHLNERMFVLSENQLAEMNQLQYYEFYFHLVRHDFLQTPFIKSTLIDYWTIFYFDEIPVINSENALIYLIRNYLTERLMKQQRLLRLKKATVGSHSKAMFAAVSALNIYLDFLRDVFKGMPQKDEDFFWKHAKHTKSLFTNEAIAQQTYPKKFVQLETQIMKKLHSVIEQNPTLFDEKVQQVILLVDEFHLIEQELFH